MIGTQPLILVVDDEPEVASFIAATLCRNGFQAWIAEGGHAALRKFKARHQCIDLVLTDVVMTDLTGPALVSQLKSIRGDLPVLYMTGYAAEKLWPSDEELIGTTLLKKPFTPAELVNAVESALGGTYIGAEEKQS